MSGRSRWIVAGVIAAACVAYQWIVHGIIADTQNASTRLTLVALNGVPHTALNLFLLWVFGRTLLRPREPLITRFARTVHGSLPPYLVSYTRNVTVAWCMFFTAQVALSVLLLAAAPLDVWSLFVNVLSFPLLVAMFVGEYVYRILRFRKFSHVSIWQGMRLFLQRSRAADTPRAEN